MQLAAYDVNRTIRSLCSGQISSWFGMGFIHYKMPGSSSAVDIPFFPRKARCSGLNFSYYLFVTSVMPILKAEVKTTS